MTRRPPISTRTDTLVPDTSLVRATKVSRERGSVVGDVGGIHPLGPRVEAREIEQLLLRLLPEGFGIRGGRRRLGDRSRLPLMTALALGAGGGRAETRRVGRRCVSTCTSRGTPAPKNTKNEELHAGKKVT